jgi:hypothetical protein
MSEDYRWLRNGSLSTLHPAWVRMHTRQSEKCRQANQTLDKRSRLSTSPGQCGVEELSPAARPIDGYHSAPKGLHYNVIRCSETSDRSPHRVVHSVSHAIAYLPDEGE